MKGKHWPQVVFGILIVLPGWLLMRRAVTGGQFHLYSRSGGGAGTALPFDADAFVLIGAGVAAFGVYVIVRTFR
jgi:hypothetical protein